MSEPDNDIAEIERLLQRLAHPVGRMGLKAAKSEGQMPDLSTSQPEAISPPAASPSIDNNEAPR